MPDDATDFLPTRRSLLSRLKRGDDQTACQTLFDTYWKLLYRVARKAGLTDAEAQDAVQETVIKVGKHIGRFRYEPAKCSFKTWLMLLTRQRIAVQFQKRQKLGARASASPAGAEPGRLKPGLRAEAGGATRTATIERIAVPAGVDLYVLRGWPARDVARTLNVNVALWRPASQNTLFRHADKNANYPSSDRGGMPSASSSALDSLRIKSRTAWAGCLPS